MWKKSNSPALEMKLSRTSFLMSSGLCFKVQSNNTFSTGRSLEYHIENLWLNLQKKKKVKSSCLQTGDILTNELETAQMWLSVKCSLPLKII